MICSRWFDWAVSFLVACFCITSSAGAQSRNLEERAHAALAPTDGHLRVPGLLKPVSVLRDRWGVAHIYAANQHDLFFAQGFVAAQDRLFQMEMWKRAGQGRLAQVLGPSALARDVNARLLRYRGDPDAEFSSYSPDSREILAAFTDGINAQIAIVNAPGTGSALPVEFQVAGFRPEPWQPEDCLNRMAAFSMTGNAFSELDHARLVAALGARQASALLELDPQVEMDPAPGANYAGLSRQLLENLVGSDRRISFPAQLLEGSNNWTVSGSLTQSGKPLLANDPHRVIALPSLRYMVHLVAPGWDVIGAGEPGLPGVALGHNQRIAWGFTIFGLDQQDLYLEEINPKDSLQYKSEDGWAKMRVERETIQVRGGISARVELRFTRHGPVLWQEGSRALALRWVGAEPGTAGYLGSLAVDRAQNWQDFERAMVRWKVPSENIVYADVDGNIGEHSTGLAPVRKNWTGLLPVPGVGGYEWAGFVPNQELPHSFNPPAGFVATANHRMIPDAYPYRVGYEWAAPYRFERITSVLAEAKTKEHKLTTNDMGRLQTDVVSLPARELVGLLKNASPDPADPAAKLLLQWDGTINADSAAAALYEIWFNVLTDALIHKAGPECVWPVFVESWSPRMILELLSRPRPELFGGSPGKQRDLLLSDSLRTAVSKLSALEGPDPARWTWGALHVVRFRHPLDNVPEGKNLLDVGPLPRPGDENTVNATGYYGESYEQVSGASYREILDLGNWDSSVAVNTPGQSGQPGSPHYSDLTQAWDRGDYFPLVYSRDAVERQSTERLQLEPAPIAGNR
jgi:penicillin amidase